MPLPKPTDLPKWATEDQIDQISGQYNVVKPPDERQLGGWYLGEKPNRQWWNWLHRQTYLWLQYFNENLDFDANSFTPVITGIDPSSLSQNDGYYSKEGDRVYISINIIWGGNGVSGPITITNLPYPSKHIPAGTFNQCMSLTRGVGPTFPGIEEVSGLILDNTSTLNIWSIDPTTGAGSTVSSAGLQGQLIITGFYFIEPTP
jgi:hypothetical protein